MSNEQKSGSGTLWENERKQSEAHPDYRGGFVIPEGFKAGDTIYLSAWLKETRNGKKLVSLSHDAREQTYQDSRVEKRVAPREDRPDSGRTARPSANDRPSARRESERSAAQSRFDSSDMDDEIPF